jgi:hypothetical protein
MTADARRRRVAVPRPARTPSAAAFVSPAFRITVVVFWALSLVAWRFWEGPADIERLLVAMLLLALAEGVVAVVVLRHCNVWVFFTVGFLQPIILALPNFAAHPDNTRQKFTLMLPLIIGAVCALGAWSASMAANKGRFDRGDFSTAVWWKTIVPFTGNAKAVGDTLQKLAMTGGIIGTIIKWVVG